MQARDANGRFLKKGADPASGVVTNTSSTTPLSSEIPELDKPLVEFSIQNPFKRILYWLNDIRKKQTTTFNMQIKIPLLALPIFLAVLASAFQFVFALGRQSQPVTIPTPTPITQPSVAPQSVLLSKTGTIKATYQIQPLLSQPSTNTPTSTDEAGSAPAPVAIATPIPTPIPYRYVLVGRGDALTFLIAPHISLQNYMNKRVLVTGMYDKIKNTLTVEKSVDIELLP